MKLLERAGTQKGGPKPWATADASARDGLAYRRSRRGEEEEEEPAVSSPSLQPPPV